MIELISNGAVGSSDDLFKDCRRSGAKFVFRSNMRNCVIFVKISKGALHILGAVYLIDILDVLRANLMDDVWTVGFVAVVMSLGLEETELSCLAELCVERGTSLRLLFRCQLSKPRVESGPGSRAPSLR